MKPGPRNVKNSEVSRQLQYRRSTFEIERISGDNRLKKRVHIPAWWFELDAYGAAVEAITVSIEHALQSGSIGVGGEDEILRQVRAKLVELDPAIGKEV